MQAVSDLTLQQQVRFSTQTANNQLNQARNNRVPTHNKRDSKLTRPVLKSESERTYQQLYNQLTEAQRNNDTARVEQTFNTMRDSPHLNYSLFNSMVSVVECTSDTAH